MWLSYTITDHLVSQLKGIGILLMVGYVSKRLGIFIWPGVHGDIFVLIALPVVALHCVIGCKSILVDYVHEDRLQWMLQSFVKISAAGMCLCALDGLIPSFLGAHLPGQRTKYAWFLTK
jgi:hypothetical protein